MARVSARGVGCGLAVLHGDRQPGGHLTVVPGGVARRRGCRGRSLGRQPAHLNDATVTAYDVPSYHGFDLVGDLRSVGVPVDVEGGWFDAGDYLKFVQTTS